MTEKELLETLKNWRYLENRIKFLNNMLSEKTFRITSSTTADAVMGGRNSVSKIESYCFARLPYIEERDEIIRRLKRCIRAYNTSNLSKMERKTIKATIKGESLIKIADEYRVTNAKIYRTRNKAVKKMFNTLQNEFLNR